MIPRRLICCGHFLPPLLIGLCIGVALNLTFLPFIEEDCENPIPESESEHLHLVLQQGSRKTNALDSDHDALPGDGGMSNQNKYVIPVKQNEPESPKEDADKSSNFSWKKLRRPRYAATELGIREKLFISFLTSGKTVSSLAVAINRTLPLLNNAKTGFFMGQKEEGKTLPDGMSLVSFSTLEVDQNLLFRTIKFLAEHYGNSYDWFAFFLDSTYLRGERLLDFVSDLSIARDLFLGENEDGGDHCSAGGGFILSNSLLMKANASIEWCHAHATAADDNGKNLGRCIEHVGNVKCKSLEKERKFQAHNVGKIQIDSLLKDQLQLDAVHQSLTVYPFSDDKSIYKIHRHVSQWEVNETLKEIEILKKEIEETSVFAPDGKASVPWPIGSAPQYKSKNRHHTIRWDYFTESEAYFKDEWSVATPHAGADREDIDDIIVRVKRALQENPNGPLEYTRLINGYRQFDPVRGMEYFLDVVVTDQTKKITKKRVHILKPLGEVEIVPMPYVTENSRVNLILPVTLETKTSFTDFMEKYANIFMEVGENTYLFIAFYYKTGVPMTGKADPYTLLKSIITYYENKYHNSAKISWMNVQSDSTHTFDLIDHLANKLTQESLILLSTPGSDIDIEFINRVRMNTIQKCQVYFPIAFWQYKPNIVYDQKPYPSTIEIEGKLGHFDKNQFVHASFYLSDYNTARSEATRLKKDLPKMDLYDLFLQCHTLHVFRATEPNLRHHFVEHRCNPLASEGEYHRCLASRANGLASSKALALLLLEGQGQGQSAWDYKSLKLH
ncbi:chondroitin sulfate glucuronyltransferase-like [Lineus longissimus]|uniref:chondroitin sulfate glucuronyltransferase-like n=1 Tax=Lineus longissimus TaxID=88925 RepID=UPI002B4E0E64